MFGDEESTKQNAAFPSDRQIQKCRGCGTEVDVRTKDWNGDARNILCWSCDNAAFCPFTVPISSGDCRMIDTAIRKGRIKVADAIKYLKVIEETIDLAKKLENDPAYRDHSWAGKINVAKRRAGYAARLVIRLQQYASGEVQPSSLPSLESRRSYQERHARRERRAREAQGHASAPGDAEV